MQKNKECDVLILIEHVAREIESAVLIKRLFERKGYSVIIDSIKFHKESIVLKYNTNIAIVPWAYSNREVDLFRSLIRKNKKVLIINMHHEQISNDGSDSFIIPQEDAKKVLHLSWGENFSNKLLVNGCDDNTIIQCGNPRLDFYKNKLKDISESKCKLANEYGLNKNKKWVLFIANSFHLLTPAQIKINISKGVDIEEQIKCSIKNREDFLVYVDKYLSENNDVEFIYRPHPSFAHADEIQNDIKELEAKYENFKCISKNSIRDWIINSDMAISFHSTSVIECCVANTEFYLFRTEQLRQDKDYRFFTDYEYCIKNYQYFYDAIKGKIKFNYDKFIKDIRYDIDLNLNNYSSQILVDKIDNIYSNIEKNYTNIDFKFNKHIKNIIYSYIKKILYNLSKNKKIENYIVKKNDIRFFNLLYKGDDYFTKNDILRIEKQIDKLINEEL